MYDQFMTLLSSNRLSPNDPVAQWSCPRCRPIVCTPAETADILLCEPRWRAGLECSHDGVHGQMMGLTQDMPARHIIVLISKYTKRCEREKINVKEKGVLISSSWRFDTFAANQGRESLSHD